MHYSRILYLAISLVYFWSINTAFGQDKIDKLLAIIDTTTDLSHKSKLMTDVSQHYWGIDPNKSIEYGKQALSLAKELQDTVRIGYALNSIGYAYSLKSNYTTATSYLLEALQLFEAIGNTASVMNVSNNLGIIYTSQEHYDQALAYFMAYYNNAIQDTVPSRTSSACANIGVVYYHLDKFDSALFFQEKYLTISEEIDDQLGVAIAKSNLADIYYGKKDYEKALATYQESKILSEKLEDVEGVILTLFGEGKVWLAYKKPEKALPLLEKSLELASKYQLPGYQKDNYAKIAEAYQQMGKYKQALEFTDQYISLKDSLFNQSNTQQLNAMQESYAVAKKEAEITEHQAQIELLHKSEEINQLIGWMMAMGLLMLGLVAAILLRNNRVKQRINQALSASKLEIEKQRDAINAHNEELQQQQEEIIAQRDAIDEQNKILESAFTEITRQNDKIVSSISYAQRIQTAMLPSKAQIAQLFPAHSLLYLPKDIVSGDFYFMKQVNGHTVVAVADCTGHGVSGAFMSMIGNDLLNEIVRVQGITQPDQILTLLDEGIRNTLQQEQTKNRDGMDIACCSLSPDGKTLQYAGAKNPLVYRSQGHTQVIKGDKRSIGGFSLLKKGKSLQPFTLHEVKLTGKTAVYLFSDGFQDQFNSDTGQKIGFKRLLSWIEELSASPWEARQKKLNYHLLEWQGKERQIDDVLVLGLEIGE